MSAFGGGGFGIVGHRGGRVTPLDPEWPAENTVASFERAIAEGADAIEIDVRLCATGEVVVFHDPDLARATRGLDGREVQAVPYLELASMRLFGDAQGVPLLRDVLLLCVQRGVGLNVEIKYDAVARGRLARAVARELARSSADVLLSSFDPRILLDMLRIAPRTPRALLTTPTRKWSGFAARRVARPPWLWAVHLERTQAQPALVRSLKQRGLRVGVWTINDAAEARDLRSVGVDWIVTDAPGRLRAELGISKSND